MNEDDLTPQQQHAQAEARKAESELIELIKDIEQDEVETNTVLAVALSSFAMGFNTAEEQRPADTYAGTEGTKDAMEILVSAVTALDSFSSDHVDLLSEIATIRNPVAAFVEKMREQNVQALRSMLEAIYGEPAANAVLSGHNLTDAEAFDIGFSVASSSAPTLYGFVSKGDDATMKCRCIACLTREQMTSPISKEELNRMIARKFHDTPGAIRAMGRHVCENIRMLYEEKSLPSLGLVDPKAIKEITEALSRGTDAGTH